MVPPLRVEMWVWRQQPCCVYVCVWEYVCTCACMCVCVRVCGHSGYATSRMERFLREGPRDVHEGHKCWCEGHNCWHEGHGGWRMESCAWRTSCVKNGEVQVKGEENDKDGTACHNAALTLTNCWSGLFKPGNTGDQLEAPDPEGRTSSWMNSVRHCVKSTNMEGLHVCCETGLCHKQDLS